MQDIEVESKNGILLRATQISFCFYLFYCFFEPYINIAIGQFGRYIIFIVIIQIIITHKKVAIRWYHVSLVIWLLLKIVSIYWVGYNYIVSIHLVSQIGMLGLYLTVNAFKLEYEYSQLAKKTLLYSSFLMGFLSLFFSQSFAGRFDTRQVLTIMNVQLDPNNQAAFLVVGIAIAIHELMIKKNRNSRIVFYVGAIIINIYSVLLTGSRGALVSLALVIFVAFVLIQKSDENKIQNIVKKLVQITGLFFLAYVVTKQFLPEEIYQRLFNFNSYSGGSERTTIWKNVIGLFYENPLIGGGWGSFWGYNDNHMAVHNTYLAELTDAGIVGLALFLAPPIYIVLTSLKNKYILPILLLISGYVPSFFLDAANKRFFWNSLIISLMMLEIHLRQKRVDNKNKQNEGGESFDQV